MSLIKSQFKINKPYVYSANHLTLVEEFKKKSREDQNGFWESTNEGVWKVIKKDLKDHYIAAQDYQCAFCLQKNVVEHNGVWDAEHIIPKATHPHFMFESQNICVVCKDCNGAKLDKPVTKAKVKDVFSVSSDDYLICHPHFDEYSLHVNVISVAGVYLPKTIKGQRLIETCGLLRFLYKYSNHDCASEEIKARTVELNNQLLEASNELELIFVYDCLEDLAKEGKRLLREKRMGALRA